MSHYEPYPQSYSDASIERPEQRARFVRSALEQRYGQTTVEKAAVLKPNHYGVEYHPRWTEPVHIAASRLDERVTVYVVAEDGSLSRELVTSTDPFEVVEETVEYLDAHSAQ